MLWRYAIVWRKDGGAFWVPFGDRYRAQMLIKDLGCGRVKDGAAVFRGEAMVRAGRGLGLPAAVLEAIQGILTARPGRGVEGTAWHKERQEEALRDLDEALHHAVINAGRVVRKRSRSE